jgi:hypothetical protein
MSGYDAKQFSEYDQLFNIQKYDDWKAL